MSNYNSLKTTIDANIKQNGRQEITGQILNSVLNQMVTTLGAGYQFAGVATIDTNPGAPDAKVFYIANGKGTYTNFGGLEVTEDDVVVLYWDSSWHKVTTGIASNEKLTELGKKVGDLFFSFTVTAETVRKIGNVNIKAGDKIKFIINGDFSADRIMLAGDYALTNRICDYIAKDNLYEVVVNFDATELYVFLNGNVSPGTFGCHFLQAIAYKASKIVDYEPTIIRTNRFTANKYPCFVGYGDNSSEESVEGINIKKASEYYKVFQSLKLYGQDPTIPCSLQLIQYNSTKLRIRLRILSGGNWVNDADFNIPIASISNPTGVSHITAIDNDKAIDAIVDLSAIETDTSVAISSTPHFIIDPDNIFLSEPELDVQDGHYNVDYKDVLLSRNRGYYDQNGALQQSDKRFTNVVINVGDIVDEVLSLSVNTKGVSGAISSAVFFDANGNVIDTIQENFYNLYKSDIPNDSVSIGFTFMFDETLGDVVCRFTGLNQALWPWEYDSITNPYKGKTGIVFGDSIINGVGALVGQDCVEAAKRILECSLYNGGIGGTTMLFFNDVVDGIVDNNWTDVDARIQQLISQYPGNPLFEVLPTRFQQIKSLDFTKVDFICVAYGTNDWTEDIQRDNAENLFDTTTILGSLRSCVKRIQSAFPNIEIIVITPSYRCVFNNNVIEYDSDDNHWGKNTLISDLGTLADLIAECAKEMKIRCWNQYWNNGVNAFNAKKFISDGTHRNKFGAAVLGRQVADFIKSL